MCGAGGGGGGDGCGGPSVALRGSRLKGGPRDPEAVLGSAARSVPASSELLSLVVCRVQLVTHLSPHRGEKLEHVESMYLYIYSIVKKVWTFII